MTFDEMIDDLNGTDCGGYSYEMEYISGPFAENSINFPTLLTYVNSNPSYMEGEAADPSWEGTHEMRLKCTIGTFDTGSPRGHNGLFNTVFSAKISMQISNMTSRMSEKC